MDCIGFLEKKELDGDKMRIQVGTKIEGHKVVEMLCSCGHSKNNHADKEITGKRIKKGNEYVTPITYEKNMGHCRKHKCDCHKYEVGAVLLDNGEALHFSSIFKCTSCKKLLNKKKIHKHSYWPHICKSCAPEYYKEKIFNISLEIEALEALKNHLTKIYPDLIKLKADVEVEYGYDYECEGTKTIEISISMIVDSLIVQSEEQKKTWEGYL